MCAILRSFDNIDEQTELQCLYLEKIKECECLEIELSKRTKNVSKEVYNELLKSFSKLEQHSISLELALQQCQEQLKNDKVWKQKKSSSFRDQNEQYFIIQDLKAQLQDMDIAIKEAKRKAQIQNDKALNSKPSVITPARLSNTASGSKPKPRNYNQQTMNWPPSMSSKVTNKDVHATEKPRNQKPFLKSKDLACPTCPRCKKCSYTANHDACILKYLSEVNSHASAQKKDAQSHKTTKRYILVEKKSDSKNHGKQIPIGKRFSPNKSYVVYIKTTPPRSGLIWKPTGSYFTYVGLRWILTTKSVETCINTNDSALPLGKETSTPNIVICVNSPSLSACTSMASEPISSKGSTNNIRVILFSIHNDDGNPSSVNIKQQCDVPAMRTSKYGESNASTLEDLTLQAGNPVKEYEHVGQGTRSQDGKDDEVKQGKDLKISESKSKSKDDGKAQDQRSQSMKKQAYNEDKDQNQNQDQDSRA
ncbi:hypothetical protein Tco_0939799 [Tanacetum coccineum]|uniref:Uncharacterized protein n=1 Tax=Tanacetum coccineum TaxID=301880 RepID=A0ABQ5DLU4_9ASTR